MTHPHSPLTINSPQFKLVERYTVVIYDKSSSLEHVNEARRELYCKNNRTMENLHPTQEALLQHAKRATYQAGIWATSDHIQQQTPSAEGYGWTWDKEVKTWQPVWSRLSVEATACSELIRCGCKSHGGCGAMCNSQRARWRCTELCSCRCEK